MGALPEVCPKCGTRWGGIKVTEESNLGVGVGCLGVILSLGGLFLGAGALSSAVATGNRILCALGGVVALEASFILIVCDTASRGRPE